LWRPLVPTGETTPGATETARAESVAVGPAGDGAKEPKQWRWGTSGEGRSTSWCQTPQAALRRVIPIGWHYHWGKEVLHGSNHQVTSLSVCLRVSYCSG